MKHIIQSPDQRDPVFKEIDRLRKTYRAAVLVFPLEFGSPLDPAPNSGEYYGFYAAPAVPNIFSWLLCDPVYYAHVHARDRIRNLPTYEQFLSKKQSIFLNAKERAFLLQKQNLDLYDSTRACMVSPSLRSFFLLDASVRSEPEPKFSFDLNKALLSNLLMEFYPPNKEIYRSLDGSALTGEEMVREVQKGSDVGKKYTSDLLRVSRDLLARQADLGK